jgi:hypothetical protein
MDKPGEIADILDRTLAITRSIAHLGAQAGEDGDDRGCDMGLLAEQATSQIQTVYDRLFMKSLQREKKNRKQ